jgi:hypothetical protein
MYRRKKSLLEIVQELLLQPRNLESSIQVAIVNYLKLRKITLFHIPNETDMKNPVTRLLKKLMGLQAGVSDLCLILECGRTAYIEIKAPKGRQSLPQKAWQKSIESLGHEYYIWRSVDDAVEFLEGK